jgi:effector-binding domain-containing protein
MGYEVRIEQADPRPIAAVRAVTTQARLGADIVRSLDQVWPVLREQGVPAGRNLVLYLGAAAGELTVDVGVEVGPEFSDQGNVRRTTTPAGEVATVAYFGDYSGMAPAYNALGEWIREQARKPAGVSWEIYGHWDDDPRTRRVDIYMLLE